MTVLEPNEKREFISDVFDVRDCKHVLERGVGFGWMVESFGRGWHLLYRAQSLSVIVTRGAKHQSLDLNDWLHASIAHPTKTPSYELLTLLKLVVWGEDGFAYQVFPSRDRHVNIHAHALHLWGRVDGANELPDFGQFGTI